MDKQQDALRNLGRRLTELRRQRQLTLAQLSSLTGLDSREIAAIEAGENDPTLTTLYALCRGLDIPPGELMPLNP
jgi:transcriptional regulator with XRE-family HTH domain